MARTLIIHDGTLTSARTQDDDVAVALWESISPEYATTIWHEVKVVVSDVVKLQGIVAFANELGRTARLAITVHELVSIGLLHAPIAPVDGRQVLSASREQTSDSTQLRLRIGHHAPVWAFLASVLAAPLSLPTGLAPATRLGISRGVSPDWLGLAPAGAFIDDTDCAVDPENTGPLPRVDRVIVAAEAAAQLPDDAGAIAHDVTVVSAATPAWSQLTASERTPAPPVETRIFNPVGVTRVPKHGWTYLRPGTAGSAVLCDDNGDVITSFETVTPGLISKIRQYWGVVDSGAAFIGPYERAQALIRLAASGVPVVSPDARSVLRGWIPDGILRTFSTSLGDTQDSEDREGQIIAQVRSAHRYGTWRSDDYAHQRGPFDELSVSVGIATMRPEYLEHVISTFDAQTWPRKQLLLGLHGFTLDEVPAKVRRRIAQIATVVEWRQDGLFGDLLRELTLRADGDLFAKMDDDDWYAPYHLEDLVYALQYSGATLVGSGVQFVYMHNADITIRRSVEQSYRFGGHPGGPTFLTARTTLLHAGNWPRVRRAVDTGLNHAILALGGSVYQSHAHNFLFNRRSSGHTWKATNSYFIEKARFSWSGIRPPLGFAESELPNLDWRSSASTVAPLTGVTHLTRRTSKPLSRPRAVEMPVTAEDAPSENAE